MKLESTWAWYGVRIIKQIAVIVEPDKKIIDEAFEKYGLYYDSDDKHTFEESI